MMDVQAMPLATIPRSQLALYNAVSQLALPTTATTPAGLFSLDQLQLQTRRPEQGLALSLQLGAQPLALWIDPGSLAHWLNPVMGLNLTEQTPLPLSLALLEKSLQGLQPVIEQRCGHQLTRIEQAHTGHSNSDCYLQARLTWRDTDGQCASLELFFPGQMASQDSEILLALLALLPKIRQREPDHLPVIANLYAGYTELEPADYRQLQVGDIILPDHNLIGQNTLWLSINNSLTASGRWLDNALTIESVTGTPLMEQPFSTPDTPTPAQDGIDLESLPIRLNFELTPLTLPLADVRKITPGYIIELQDNPDATVLITVNGQTIGRGELVSISGHSGIRVLAFDDGADHDRSEPTDEER